MQGTFKKCPNGHYYQGDSCPYCKSSSSHASTKTEIFVGTNGETELTGGSYSGPTVVEGNNSNCGSSATVVDGTSMGQRSPHKKMGTVFGDDEEENINQEGLNYHGQMPKTRYGRKLVGWLVTYSQDELGTDYKLFEGRNVIGRDEDCGITVDDGRMSAKHAVLLFRAGKYSLTDSQSSHGTFVNGEDIELEPCYLSDGDIIRMGSTEFKFRSSL